MCTAHGSAVDPTGAAADVAGASQQPLVPHARGGRPGAHAPPLPGGAQSGSAFAQDGAAAGAGNVAPRVNALPRQHTRPHGSRTAVPAPAPAPASDLGSTAAAPAGEAAAVRPPGSAVEQAGVATVAEQPGFSAAAPATGAAGPLSAPAASRAGRDVQAAPAPAPDSGMPQGAAGVSEVTGGLTGGPDEQAAVSDRVAGPYADIPYGNPHGKPRAKPGAQPAEAGAPSQRAADAPGAAAARPGPAASAADAPEAVADGLGSAAGGAGSKRLVAAMGLGGSAGPDTAGPAAAPLAAAAGASSGPEAGIMIRESGGDPAAGSVERTAGARGAQGTAALAAPAPAPTRSNPIALVPGGSKGLTSVAAPMPAPLLRVPVAPELGDYGSAVAAAPLPPGK